jgi:hypothetical protein
MALTQEQEEERIRRLSAMEASVPQYLQMQGEGASALGDILGIDTPSVDTFTQRQERALGGFRSKHPGRLLASEKPVEWWKEKAALNSMNTIAPMLGFAIGNTMKAIPTPVTRLLGTAINWATAATTYNMNFADTLAEHEQAAGRELTPTEKSWAATVGMGVTYLDLIAPRKGATETSKLLTKAFGRGGVNATRDSLVKLVNTNRDKLAKQVLKGGKFSAGIIGTEMATEAGQKALQIATSKDPGKLGTSEGLQEVGEEALIAGPIAGAITTPAAIGVGREQNRDLGTARRLAKNYNRDLLASAPDTLADIRENKDFIDIPKGKGYESEFKLLAEKGNKAIKDLTNVDIKEAAKQVTSAIAFKGTDPLLKLRNRAKSGLVYNSANRILQMFQPTETGSGEQGSRFNFFSLKETKSGTYLKDVINIVNKYSNKKMFLGQIGKSISDDMSKYILHKIDPKRPVANLPKEFKGDTDQLAKDIQTIKDTIEVVRKDMVDSGLLAETQSVEDYLTNPISKESVKANREAFIRLLVLSSQQAVADKGGKVKEITKEEATEIANGIIDGYDPSVRIDRPEEAEFTGQNKKSFEKSRSEAWANLDKLAEAEGLNFREQNIEKVLTNYLQNAATRVASATVFGKDASKLKAELAKLNKAGEITEEEVNRAYDLYDASHNVYKKDANRNALAASKFATTVGAMTHLGLATLSSLSELAWIGERAGFGHMLATLPKAFKYAIDGTRKGVSGQYIAPGESATAMATLGFNLDPRVNERLDQIFSTDTNKVLSIYFRTPLGGMLTQFTNFNRNWAAQAMMSNINHRANSIIAGDISDIEQRRLDSELRENGLTREDFSLITNAFRGEDGKVRVDITRDDILDKVIKKETRQVAPANKKKKKKEDIRELDVTVRDLLIPWLHKVVDDVVVHPKAYNKPLWMSDPRMAILAQLKTFPVVFGNTVVKRLLRKLNPKQCSPDYGAAIGVVGAIAMAYALVYSAEMMKDAIKGKDFEDPKFKEVLDRMGLTGAVGMVAGAGRFHEGAVVGLGGTAIGAINTVYSEILTPIWTADEGGLEDEDPLANLGAWLAGSLDASLGAIGIGFKPTQNLFGVDE